MRKRAGWPLALTVLLLFAVCVAKALAEHDAVTTAPPPAAKNDEHDIHAGIPQTVVEWARGAMLFDGLGDFHRKATTSSAEAQKFFDQGMRYLWAFNHDESTRSFAQAAGARSDLRHLLLGCRTCRGPELQRPNDGAAACEGRLGSAWTSRKILVACKSSRTSADSRAR